MSKIPNLTDIRKHIRKHGWNGQDAPASTPNREYFRGQCEYTATAVSEMLTDPEGTNWSLRVRGWYRGEITAINPADKTANFDPTGTKHAHSWVVLPDGRIVDPTFWQFTDAPVKVYVFEPNDSRFEIDMEA